MVLTFRVKIAETLVVELPLSWRLLQAWFHVSLMVPDPSSLCTVGREKETQRSEGVTGKGVQKVKLLSVTYIYILIYIHGVVR